MAMAKSAVIFFLVMMGLCVVSNSMALVYKVGDNDGWSSLGHVDYAKWASTKNFHVGDALREDLITLGSADNFYYLCGVPGHCQAGQKVGIKVTPISPFPRASLSPTPSVSPSPYGSSPESTSTGPVLHFNIKPWMLVSILAFNSCPWSLFLRRFNSLEFPVLMELAMASLAKGALVLFCVMALIGVCFGAVYTVGDSQGWTNTAHVDYKAWADFQYSIWLTDVIEVSHKHFRSCNLRFPLEFFNSGRDSITMLEPRHYYYVSSFPGHCLDGQKVDIKVLPASQRPSTNTPSPTPTPITNSPSPSPSTKNPTLTPIPSPSPSTNSPTSTPIPIPSPSPSTNSPTPTPIPSPSPSTNSPTSTPIPSISPSPSTNSPTSTPIPSISPSPSTNSPTSTPISSISPSPSTNPSTPGPSPSPRSIAASPDHSISLAPVAEAPAPSKTAPSLVSSKGLLAIQLFMALCFLAYY
uniref:Phytocyanin domain-containing protein n=1 Tax=Fagus sylvatica TaxID=28930 RepID=A0A2N9H0V7_FAGSY